MSGGQDEAARLAYPETDEGDCSLMSDIMQVANDVESERMALESMVNLAIAKCRSVCHPGVNPSTHDFALAILKIFGER